MRISSRSPARSFAATQGVGITEVVVALMVFSLIAVGIAYSMFSMTRLTHESTNRETAVPSGRAGDRPRSLRSSTPSRVYSSTDDHAPSMASPTRSRPLWAGSRRPAPRGSCGSGGGNLQYKRVNVAVTWPGHVPAQPRPRRFGPRAGFPHQRPELRHRARLGARRRRHRSLRRHRAGHARERWRRHRDHRPDRRRPTSTAAPTCCKVAPGKYKIEVERSGYVSSSQVAVPSFTQQVVAAGSTTTASFQYDAAGSYTLVYAASLVVDAVPAEQPRDHLHRRPRELRPVEHVEPAQAAPVPVGLPGGRRGSERLPQRRPGELDREFHDAGR